MDRRPLLPAALFLGLLAIGSGGTLAQNLGLGAQPQVPGPSAEARGVSGYKYNRNGAAVSVDVVGSQGKNMAVLNLEWPDGQGALIDCSTPDGRHFFLNWREDHGYLKIEDRDRGEGVEIQLVDGQWQIDGERAQGRQHPFLLRNEETIGFIIDAYEDALTNLGLRQLREEQMMNARAESNQSSQATLSSEKPQVIRPPQLNEKIMCGLFACDGPLFVETEDGFTREGCCADAVFWLGVDCALNGPCDSCCRFTCTTLCLVGDYVCSCTGTGRACGTPIACDEEWPPPCT